MISTSLMSLIDFGKAHIQQHGPGGLTAPRLAADLGISSQPAPTYPKEGHTKRRLVGYRRQTA